MNRVLIALLFATGLHCQTTSPTNWAGIGIGYSSQITGMGLYAKGLTSTTYSFSVLDIIPTSYKPVIVTTQVSTGIAQRLFTVKGVECYIPTAAGISYTGTNTGWNWTTGGLVSIPVKGFRLFPNLRVLKSSVVTGYQLFGGLMVGWGW